MEGGVGRFVFLVFGFFGGERTREEDYKMAVHTQR